MADFINRNGEFWETRNGECFKIIEYFNCKNCTIQFENGVKMYNQKYGCIIRGNIRSPMYKSVLNIGYLGVGKYVKVTKGIKSKAYSYWAGMLARSYNEKHKINFPTYLECSVCEEWHNFQNFAKWFEENYDSEKMKGWHLDKDIIVKGNKIYSPENCCFVPCNINILFVKRDSKRGENPIGVTSKNGMFRANINYNKKICLLGIFNNSKEAFESYKIAKENYIKQIADEWKGIIADRTYTAMYKYRVEITD